MLFSTFSDTLLAARAQAAFDLAWANVEMNGQRVRWSQSLARERLQLLVERYACVADE